jgi:hypothetical protein
MDKFINIRYNDMYIHKIEYVRNTFKLSNAKLMRYLIDNRITLNEVYELAKQHNEKYEKINYEFLIENGLHF